MLTYDIAIVGEGIAALRAALVCAPHTKSVAIIAKIHPLRALDSLLNDGVAAAVNRGDDGDTPEAHLADTLRMGDYLVETAAAERLAERAPKALWELEHWGCPFARQASGKVAQDRLPGHSHARTAHVDGYTGMHVLQTLYHQAVRQEVRVYEDWLVSSLVTEDNIVEGILAYDIQNGEYKAVKARAVIFANSGGGNLYARTVNGSGSAAYQMGLALRAGSPLRDMEFVAFAPAALPDKGIGLPEAARPLGAKLLANGKPVADDETLAWAPADVLARRVAASAEPPKKKRRKKADVELTCDLSAVPEAAWTRRLANFHGQIQRLRGIDARNTAFEIAPAQRALLGGVPCGLEGETNLKGFYVASETASTGLHGAGLLPGNDIVESLLWGEAAGHSALAYLRTEDLRKQRINVVKRVLREETIRLDAIFAGRGTDDPYVIRRELAELMMEHFGLVREKAAMEKAQGKIAKLRERFEKVRPAAIARRFNYDKAQIMEIEANLQVAAALAVAALAREESRGAHARSDFPDRNDETFLRHSMVTLNEEGDVMLAAHPEVDLKGRQPEERLPQTAQETPSA